VTWKISIIFILFLMFISFVQARASVYNIKEYGATGNGKTLDSPAINKAIEEATTEGGGTVYLPAGKYLSVSIRLKSNITLYLEQGAKIIAASPKEGYKYDFPEENPSDMYQDFGHTYFHNSLIWGENLENVSIIGPGIIDGAGLVREGKESRSGEKEDSLKYLPPKGKKVGPFGYPNASDLVEAGWGNKAIALKLCRNVTIKDLTILHGGHFAILVTGVDNLTINNLLIDTNRDGIDIDCCNNVRVSDCSVNSPRDDGICLKSSYALGYLKPTENVTITNCMVSGYSEYSLFNGTYVKDSAGTPATGRIKLGTEANGGFKNITISNCVFDYCRGLAVEEVDGGFLEDVTITNITMRDITNSPIFIRLGSRNRGPGGTRTGQVSRIIISNIVVYGANPKYCSLISGVPGHNIKDIRLDNIKLYYTGGGLKAMAFIQPPEVENGYPEPDRFGTMPSYGFFIRHVAGLQMSNMEVNYIKPDARPPFLLEDVKNSEFSFIKADKEEGIPTFKLKNVTDFETFKFKYIQDVHLSYEKQKEL
jgi:polygalacturonase